MVIDILALLLSFFLFCNFECNQGSGARGDRSFMCLLTHSLTPHCSLHSSTPSRSFQVFVHEMNLLISKSFNPLCNAPVRKILSILGRFTARSLSRLEASQKRAQCVCLRVIFSMHVHVHARSRPIFRQRRWLPGGVGAHCRDSQAISTQCARDAHLTRTRTHAHPAGHRVRSHVRVCVRAKCTSLTVGYSSSSLRARAPLSHVLSSPQD